MAAKKKAAKKKVAKRKGIAVVPVEPSIDLHTTEDTTPDSVQIEPRDLGGRPCYEPTDEDKARVKALVGYGMRQEEIAKVVYNPDTGRGISKQTLARYFRKELDEGAIVANAKVAQSLYNKAIGGGNGSTVAAIFWLKARAGWTETMQHEVTSNTGVLVVPAQRTVSDWVTEQRQKNIGRKSPVEE